MSLRAEQNKDIQLSYEKTTCILFIIITDQG